MTTRSGLAMAEGRDPADDEAGQVAGLLRGGAAQARLPDDRRQAPMSTRLAPLTSATPPPGPPAVGATKTRLLTIWPSSASTARAASAAVWVDSLNTTISSSTPLRRGGVEHALDGPGAGDGPRPESSIGLAGTIRRHKSKARDRGAPLRR